MRKFSDISKKTKKIFEQEEQNVGFSASQMNGEQQQQQPLVQVQVQGETVQQQQQPQQQKPTEEKSGEQSSENDTVIKFFSKLFESREMAHIFHLQVKGDTAYSNHKSLEEYYDSIVDMIDNLIETYQGQYGIVDGYDIIDPSNIKDKKPLEYFESLAEYLKHARKCISNEDSHLNGIIDEIVGLVYRTIFKLKFL